MTRALAVAGLLAGRSNAEREAAVARALASRGVPFVRHAFATDASRGESFAVDLGSGDRVFVLCAHHDAVPGSPGANDNAAAVGILLELLGRVTVGSGLRVRLLFTAAEELDYLGARAYVRDVGVSGVVGVLSLELCGIGDSLVVWDAVEDTWVTRALGSVFEGLGLQRDAGYHVIGRIPRFGSDHRAFAAAGVPAYGLTVVPSAHADALRRFIFRPRWGALRFLVRRPAPFDTYHTPRDGLETLEPRALDLTARALEAAIAAFG